mgnify:CR=1 FL=1
MSKYVDDSFIENLSIGQLETCIRNNSFDSVEELSNTMMNSALQEGLERELFFRKRYDFKGGYNFYNDSNGFGSNLVDKAHEFKFPKLKSFYDENIIITAKTFFREGSLNLPHSCCVFEIDFFTNRAIKILIAEMPNFLCVSLIGSEEKIAFKVGWDCNDLPRLHGLEYNGRVYCDVDCDPIIANKLWDAILCCLMILNMPKYYSRETVKPSEKLNKKRLLKGKKPLKSYVKIDIHKQYKHLILDKEGSSNFLRPHWRRGHVRRLKSGKKTFVSPCMVNFNGEVIPPTDYAVRGVANLPQSALWEEGAVC